MSRLIDKFQKAAKSSPQPMGFRTARDAVKEPGILLIVGAPPEAIKNVNDIGKAGAVLVRPDAALTPKNVQKIIAALPDVPAGLYIEDADDKELEALAEAGADFFIFPASGRIIPAANDKKTGRILQVESSLDDSLLRAVNGLPVDAVLVSDTFTGGALSWHELMIFQHLGNTLAKPLIFNIPADITEDEMKALFEAGADGVLVDGSALKAGDLKKIMESIAKLPPRAARKRGRIEVMLPRPGGEGPAPPPPDEEEEDE